MQGLILCWENLIKDNDFGTLLEGYSKLMYPY